MLDVIVYDSRNRIVYNFGLHFFGIKWYRMVDSTIDYVDCLPFTMNMNKMK